MATCREGIMGYFNGKVGTVVGCVWDVWLTGKGIMGGEMLKYLYIQFYFVSLTVPIVGPS